MSLQIKFKPSLSKRVIRLMQFICRSHGVHYQAEDVAPQHLKFQDPAQQYGFKFREPRASHPHLKGDIRLHKQFYSRYLEFERDIIVYLPPSYKTQTHRRYPVLYMHDGNNTMDPRTSFAGVAWEVNDTVERLVKEGLMDEIIVVGVYNTPARMYEYTWTQMVIDGPHPQGGHGKKYARFLTKELKQFIDHHYRTLSDRNNTAIMGSSLGGLINFYIGRHYHDVFGKVAMMSPSFWWGNGIVYKHVQNYPRNLKLWMDMGIYECGSDQPDANSYTLRMTRKMREMFIRLGYKESDDFSYFEDPHGHHNEYSWARRLHRPLLFFFAKKPQDNEQAA